MQRRILSAYVFFHDLFFSMIIACCCVKINIATSYFYKTEQMMEE